MESPFLKKAISQVQNVRLDSFLYQNVQNLILYKTYLFSKFSDNLIEIWNSIFPEKPFLRKSSKNTLFWKTTPTEKNENTLCHIIQFIITYIMPSLWYCLRKISLFSLFYFFFAFGFKKVGRFYLRFHGLLNWKNGTIVPTKNSSRDSQIPSHIPNSRSSWENQSTRTIHPSTFMLFSRPFDEKGE